MAKSKFSPFKQPADANDSASTSGAYVSVDALLQLRHLAKDLSLESNRKSVALMEGDSRTSFRGRGMEFAEVRPYQAGDDIRNIDWRVTARTQKPYTKLFQEERERPIFLVVDQRSPMFFGSKRQFKSVFAAKLAAVIAWTAMQQNDRIGALIFSDASQTDSKPRRGKHAALSIIHQLSEFNHQLKNPFAQSSEQSLEDMLHDIRRVAKPGSSVHIMSDCHDFTERCQEPLAILARHCEVNMTHIYDELEWHLPGRGAFSISNGQQKLNISGQSQQFNHAFTSSFEQQLNAIRYTCHQSGVKFASIPAHSHIKDVAYDLFTARRSRSGGR